MTREDDDGARRSGTAAASDAGSDDAVGPLTARYLARVGVDPASVASADADALERLQAAHVRRVPFETLSITGDPFGDRPGEGVSLAVPDLYEAVVEKERGGFCFELNGLFGWLLARLGFDATRVAARVVGDDGARPPANHLTTVVDLSERYLVDVGLGQPGVRRPLPLSGESRTDAAGFEWRVTPSDRPDADYRTQLRRPGESAWSTRYVFTDRPRERDYFEATCEYLATAPESPFTGDPVVAVATDDGYAKLSGRTLTVAEATERERGPLGRERWYDALESTFGVVW
jgi:N-hydroxyarylamine O-acetyltransferase